MNKTAAAVLIFCAVATAAKKPPPGFAEDAKVRVTATLIPADEANRRFGYDFENHFTVLDVRVEPKAGETLDVHLDDFLLRSDRDGDRSTPFEASQIAGEGALVVSRTREAGGGMGTGSNGPVWGGLPGTMGRPSQLPGDSPNIGNTAVIEGRKGEIKDDNGNKPLKIKLKEQILADRKTASPVQGLLFFPLEKQKPKDLELIYKTADGKLRLRFR